jgi:hypothetical protein
VLGYTTRKTCRVCGSTKLVPLFSLGEQYVSDFVDEDKIESGRKVPIDVELCEFCTLVQAKHTAPQDFLYSRFYWYKSGVTQTMRDALAGVAQAAERAVGGLYQDDIVLDVGSNDGTLLRSYSTGPIKVGVEPATNLAAEGSKGIQHFINDFWNADAFLRATKNRKAKIVTACGMFYDLEDPNQFIADVAKVLADDGVFIAQLMCLRQTVRSMDVGNFAHEHLEFYSLQSLFHLLMRHGLGIYDVQENDVNGGSYRLFICKVGGSSGRNQTDMERQRIVDAHIAETNLANPKVLRQWFSMLEKNRDECEKYVGNLLDDGKRVWVYGASTKGNVILQWHGFHRGMIEAASERSPEKIGKYTVGTGIPIRSEDEMRRSNPEYALVLPYSFIHEFCAREKQWRSKGGRFLVPLPKFRVV